MWRTEVSVPTLNHRPGDVVQSVHKTLGLAVPVRKRLSRALVVIRDVRGEIDGEPD